jgi:hypothetical protein
MRAWSHSRPAGCKHSSLATSPTMSFNVFNSSAFLGRHFGGRVSEGTRASFKKMAGREFARRQAERGQRPQPGPPYFRALETDPKVLLRLCPTPCTTVIIMTEIDAAMRPYSMAAPRIRHEKDADLPSHRKK